MKLEKQLENNKLKQHLIGILVLISMILLSFTFDKLNIKNENSLMIFLTGVLIIVIETGSYLAGFITSIFCIFFYNYFFTAPYHSFLIYDINNIISLIIFFIVSFIAGIIASKMKQQIVLTSKLEKAQAEVEKEKERSILLRSISHDLRSPLTGIAGSSSFLADNYDSTSKEDAVALLRDMENDSQSLTRMIENLLNMTRIQEGMLAIQKKNEVLDDIISESVSRVVKKNCTHKVTIDSASEILVVPVDSRLMIQVFSNLIDNAIKHTPESSTITIKSVLSEDKKNAIVSVKDNGKGILSGMEEKIFDTFKTGISQGDKGRGLGLGLSICKTIVKAHGGIIKASNAKEGGAVFVIALPLK